MTLSTKEFITTIISNEIKRVTKLMGFIKDEKDQNTCGTYIVICKQSIQELNEIKVEELPPQG